MNGADSEYCVGPHRFSRILIHHAEGFEIGNVPMAVHERYAACNSLIIYVLLNGFPDSPQTLARKAGLIRS